MANNEPEVNHLLKTAMQNAANDAVSIRALAKEFYNAVLATPGTTVMANSPGNAARVAKAAEMLRHGLEATPQYLDTLAIPSDKNVVAQTVQGATELPGLALSYADISSLIDLLREAASIIESIPPGHEPDNMRFPIVDELSGFAGMLENVQGTASRPKQRA